MPTPDIIGLDLADRGARIVVVDGEGVVAGRATGVWTTGAELAGIAATALGAARQDRPRLVGLAAADAQVPGVRAAAASLAAAWGGATVHVIESGAACVLGEAWCGTARGATNVVAFALGERVVAGLLLGGRLWTGSHGLAGSAAWLALNPVEREDYRKLGCLEAEVGAAGIVRRLVWRIKAGDRSSVLDLAGGDLSAITLEQVFIGARENDGVAISVIRDTVKYLGMAIANLAAAVDPELVVLGGTMHAAGDQLIQTIRTECARRMSPPMYQAVRIELGALGPDGIAVGAARHAILASSPAHS
jgi:predicted NBD/HSP70 family sugar kinase